MRFGSVLGTTLGEERQIENEEHMELLQAATKPWI